MRKHPSKLRSVFMGTPAFAARSLKELIKNEMTPELIFSQPSRRSGRGMHRQAPPVVDLAVAHGISVEQPQRASSEEAVMILKEVKPDIIIVVAYGELLKKEVLDIPSYGCINLHASLLPKYRGAAPVPWAILSGERITGVTTFFLDEGMDSGRMLLQEKVDINGDDTSLSLTEKLADEGAKLLVKSIQTIEKGNFRSTDQNEEEVTFAPKIRKEHGYIKWNDTAEQIVRHVRAMFPWPGTFSVLYDKNEPVVLRLFDAELVSQKEGAPGQILEIDDSGMIVMTGSGAVRFKLLQAPGGKKLAPGVYARGHNLRPGIVLREKE